MTEGICTPPPDSPVHVVCRGEKRQASLAGSFGSRAAGDLDERGGLTAGRKFREKHRRYMECPYEAPTWFIGLL